MEAAGDGALIVTLGETMSVATSEQVVALARTIMAETLPGISEAVPGMTTLTIHLDPETADADALAPRLEAFAASVLTHAEDTPPPRRWVIPVCYGTDFAPDLADVSAHAGLSPEAVVARHAASDYHVYMLGFLPGFPYMGDLDPALRLPRRATPRTAVPAGAVAIAGAMTAIYPLESPGGWHIVGRTPAPLFDPATVPPASLAAGDRVTFRPIDAAEFARLAQQAAAGQWRLSPEEAGAEAGR